MFNERTVLYLMNNYQMIVERNVINNSLIGVWDLDSAAEKLTSTKNKRFFHEWAFYGDNETLSIIYGIHKDSIKKKKRRLAKILVKILNGDDKNEQDQTIQGVLWKRRSNPLISD